MNWYDGLRAAREEYADQPHNLGVALMLFATDPPDTSFQRGYREGVRRMLRKYEPEIEELIALYLTD